MRTFAFDPTFIPVIADAKPGFICTEYRPLDLFQHTVDPFDTDHLSDGR